MFGMEFLPGPDSKSCVNNIHDVVGPQPKPIPTNPRAVFSSLTTNSENKRMKWRNLEKLIQNIKL